VHAVAGPGAGTTYDAAEALGRGPCALLFVHELSRNTAPVVRAFDRLAAEYGLLGFRASSVFLADDRTAGERQCERSSAALGLHEGLVVSVDGSDGPGGYGLNRKCTLTLVLGKEGRVVRSVGFTDTGRQDIPQLETWIAELAGTLPADQAGLVRLLAARFPAAEPELVQLTASLLRQVRRGEQDARDMRPRAPAARRPAAAAAAAERPRAGKPPEDAELARLLRAAIQRTASTEDLDEVFRAVGARVGEDAGLRRQAVEMFELMLALEYGTEAARERARRWVADHRGKE
jgi:hypothetical protein